MNIGSEGRKSLPSIIGTVVSIAMFLGIISYGGYRVKFVFEGYGGKITSSEVEDFFTSDDKFSA